MAVNILFGFKSQIFSNLLDPFIFSSTSESLLLLKAVKAVSEAEKNPDNRIRTPNKII
jgi:hypothetical protein